MTNPVKPTLPKCPDFLLDDAPKVVESEEVTKARMKKQKEFDEELMGLIKVSFGSLRKDDSEAA